MSKMSKWFVVPFFIILVTGILSHIESRIPAAAWWGGTIIVLSILAVWKHLARNYLGQKWDSNLTEQEIETIKPIAYTWLAIYFLSTGGFIVLTFASLYTGWSLSYGIMVMFLAVWLMKMELWGLFVLRRREMNSPRSKMTPP